MIWCKFVLLPHLNLYLNTHAPQWTITAPCYDLWDELGDHELSMIFALLAYTYFSHSFDPCNNWNSMFFIVICYIYYKKCCLYVIYVYINLNFNVELFIHAWNMIFNRSYLFWWFWKTGKIKEWGKLFLSPTLGLPYIFFWWSCNTVILHVENISKSFIIWYHIFKQSTQYPWQLYCWILINTLHLCD